MCVSGQTDMVECILQMSMLAVVTAFGAMQDVKLWVWRARLP